LPPNTGEQNGAPGEDPIVLLQRSRRWLLATISGLAITVIVGGLAILSLQHAKETANRAAREANTHASLNSERITALEELTKQRDEQIRSLGGTPITLPPTTVPTRAPAVRSTTSVRTGAATTTARSATTTAPNPTTSAPSPSTTVQSTTTTAPVVRVCVPRDGCVP
jgi:hypothetical protein